MKKSRKRPFLCLIKKGFLFTSFLWIVACQTEPKNIFVREEKVNFEEYEQVATVAAQKEGLYLFWLIPLFPASTEEAKNMIEEKTRKVYPQASGVYELVEISEEGVSLFDWRVSRAFTGKVIQKKQGGEL